MNRVFCALLIAWQLLVWNAYAATCDSIFSAGVQAHSASGYLEMNMQSRVIGGSTLLNVPSIIDNAGYGWKSCGAVSCSATGGFNAPVNLTIPAGTGSDGSINIAAEATATYGAGHYGDVSVEQQGTLNFSTSGGKYYMGKLTTNWRSIVNFAPGDYYINGDLSIHRENIIGITGNGPVRIFVNGSVTVQFATNITHGHPENLLIFAQNTISFDESVRFSGFLYSQTGDVLLGFMVRVTGGVSAAGRIHLNNLTWINYTDSINTADFGSLCSLTPSINDWNINTGNGAASTCSDFPVTISARDSNNSVLTGYTGTINLSTSSGHGKWKKSNGDAFGDLTASSNDNGQASYTFSAADQGEITLLLDNQHAENLQITVSDGGVNAISNRVTFSANAFVIETADADVIAGRPHSFTAKLMTQDISSPSKSCRVAELYNNANVKMWLVRDSADPGGAAPAITAGGQTFYPPNSTPANDNIQLGFNSGIANFTLLASDVGKYRLAISDTSGNFSDSHILGQSNVLIARPFGINVAVTGNTGAVDSGGTKFRVAGHSFTLTVTAVGWQSADDQNNDGIPDGHNDNSPGNNADLADNPPLVSFGKENPAQGISANSVLISPADGENPGLSGGSFTAFTVGTASSAVSFGEVGIIEIAASVAGGNYLGSTGSSKIIGKSGYVGRFYPDHFRLSDLSLTPACSSVLPFSYLDETFSFSAKITPYGAHDLPLKNYKDGFNKFSTADLQSMLSAIDEAGSTLLSGRITNVWAEPSLQDGVLALAPQLSIARAANLDGPFSSVRIGFKPLDSDGVTVRLGDLDLDLNNDGIMDTVRVNSVPTRLRYGRLRLDDSYGPETADLPVVFQTEYWNGSQWIKNLDDSCSTIPLNKIIYPDGAIHISSNRTASVGGGSTTGRYAYLNATTVGFNAGDAGHYFTAPGAGNTGSITVKVDLTDLPWLMFDWDNDGVPDAQLPDAQFSFGNYRGHDRVLYWLEMLR